MVILFVLDVQNNTASESFLLVFLLRTIVRFEQAYCFLEMLQMTVSNCISQTMYKNLKVDYKAEHW